jgi:hypothetical protein
VANWLSWADYREPSEFIEAIPFSETRNYVFAVLRNAEMYRKLYGAGGPLAGAGLGVVPAQAAASPRKKTAVKRSATVPHRTPHSTPQKTTAD